MRTITTILILTVSLAMVLPTVSAAGMEVGFTTATHSITGVLQLAETSEDDGEVALPTTGKIWAKTTPLAVSAHGTGSYDVTLMFSAGGGDVKVSIGYLTPAGSFVTLGHNTVAIADKAVDPKAPVGHPVLGGVAITTVQIPSSAPAMPAGSYQAVKLEPTVAKTFVTSSTNIFGQKSPSSATVPLPELSALVLMSVGLVGIAGVVYMRRR